MEDLSPRSFDLISDKIKSDPATATAYFSAKYSGRSNKAPADLKTTMHLYCSTKYSVSEDALKCLGLQAQVHDIMRFAQQLLPGAWYFDQC